MIETNERRRFIEQMEGLPTLPTIMLKIFECIDDPRSSAEDLKKIIVNDMAISARVLKIANSAYFGVSREIFDVSRAIVVLGFDLVIDIAVSVSLASLMAPKEGALVLPTEQLWEHCIAAGQAGKLVAKAAKYPQIEQAFMTGLFHDIGKAAMAAKFTRDFNSAVEQAQDCDEFLWEAEEKIFGFTHADSGAWLARYWKFPEQLIMPIQYHHRPGQMPGDYKTEVLIAHVANYITKKSGIGSSGDGNKLYQLHEDTFTHLQIDEDTILALTEELSQQRDLIKAFVEAIM